MIRFSNQLSAAEAERLALLLEEAAEVQQIIGKILRHGYDSRNPQRVGAWSNRRLLEIEMGHLRYAAGLLLGAGDVNGGAIDASHDQKALNIKPWLHHQGER